MIALFLNVNLEKLFGLECQQRKKRMKLKLGRVEVIGKFCLSIYMYKSASVPVINNNDAFHINLIMVNLKINSIQTCL